LVILRTPVVFNVYFEKHTLDEVELAVGTVPHIRDAEQAGQYSANDRQPPRLHYAGISPEGHAAARKACLMRALANKQIRATGLPFLQLLVADLAIAQ